MRALGVTPNSHCLPRGFLTRVPQIVLINPWRREAASWGEVDGDKEGHPLKGGLKAEEETGVSSAVHTALSPLSLVFCLPYLSRKHLFIKTLPETRVLHPREHPPVL